MAIKRIIFQVCLLLPAGCLRRICLVHKYFPGPGIIVALHAFRARIDGSTTFTMHPWNVMPVHFMAAHARWGQPQDRERGLRFPKSFPGLASS